MMLVFINGSVNAGKTTAAKLLAQKLGAEFLDIDEIAHSIPNFDLSKDIPQAIQMSIDKINELNRDGKSVIANYVLRQEDYKQLVKSLQVNKQYFITLAPRLEVARSDRGRGLNDWEYHRIKHHYDSGIANPSFGMIIDNSDITPQQTVEKIIAIINS